MKHHHPLGGKVWRRWGALSIVAGVACAWLAAAQAQEVETDERSQVVAQKVFGILAYTRWPHALATVRLCVLGPTEYADELLKGGKLANGRGVQVQRMRLDDPHMLAECNGVYAGIVSDDDWRELLGRLAGQPLLTISERKSLCHIGGMFCLDVLRSGVAFEVNLDSVARSGVRVNPRVLQLARRKAVP